MPLVSTELSTSTRPDVFVCVDCLIPSSNPVHIARHSPSNWFAVKANLSFSDLLRYSVGDRIVLKSVKNAVEVDGV